MKFKPYFRLFSDEIKKKMLKGRYRERIRKEIQHFGEKLAVVPMRIAKHFNALEVTQERILRNLRSSACKKGHIHLHSPSHAGFRIAHRRIGDYKTKATLPFRKPHPRIPFRELTAFYNG